MWNRGVELHTVASHVEPLPELHLTALFGIERRPVRLGLRQRSERVGERAIKIDGWHRLVHEAHTARKRFGVARQRLVDRRLCLDGIEQID